MEIRMIIFMSSLLVPLALFTFFRRFLNEEKYQKKIRITLSFVASIGILIVILNNKSYLYYLLLLFPLLAYWIHNLCLFWFRKKMGRDPIDTAMDWRSGLQWDRLFNIGYVIIGIIIPFSIFVLIITN